jgi:hypothetical protein
MRRGRLGGRGTLWLWALLFWGVWDCNADLEKRVLEGGSAGGALGGVPQEEVSHELNRLRRRVRRELRQGRWNDLREPVVHRRGELKPLRPRLLRRGAEDGRDLKQHVSLVLAGEERPEHQQLRHDAPNGPHVNGGVVNGRAQENLRRAVPPRRDVLRKGGARADLARKAVVGDFSFFAADKDVFGFDVSEVMRRGLEGGGGTCGRSRACACTPELGKSDSWWCQRF